VKHVGVSGNTEHGRVKRGKWKGLMHDEKVTTSSIIEGPTLRKSSRHKRVIFAIQTPQYRRKQKFKTLFQNFSAFVEFEIFKLLYFSRIRAEYNIKIGNYPFISILCNAYSYVYSIRWSCFTDALRS